MTRYMSRSDWTDTARGGDTLTGTKLVGVSVHYPADGDVLYRNLTREQVVERLNAWRNYHVNVRGWSDIGYQVAIDGKGRVWDLRGISRVPAATASDANPDANWEWGACLFVVGNTEQPTAEAVQAFVDWRNQRWLRKWPRANRVVGHQQVFGAQTACPGVRLMELVNNGTLTQEGDMATAEEIAAAVWSYRQRRIDADGDMRTGTMLAQTHNRAGGARTEAADDPTVEMIRTAVVEALASVGETGSVTEAELERIVEQVIRRVFGSLGQ